MSHHLIDHDSSETREWQDALQSVINYSGAERAQFLLQSLIDQARMGGIEVNSFNTPYLNTIAVTQQPIFPGDLTLEEKNEATMRWNAMMMVLRAGKVSSELGGHIATYASSATLYEVGFNHFFHAPSQEHGGDLIFFQGHASPGIYARSFLEGRLSEAQLNLFRQEIIGNGLSSYPHPWLMPDFWQFPTVSMGLGPMQAIYTARFLKYLHHREVCNTKQRKVWMFCGDGEMDEPESLGALSIASRERLDNLIFVINCNLQRLDGPVRGNGQIISELERIFRGSGWHVIKVLWGSNWDPILARDENGVLQNVMARMVDGAFQTYWSKDGAYIREHFFGADPKLKELVSDLSDDELRQLKRGGHDPIKVYAAYDAAVHHQGQPVVILANTIKGYGMGSAGEGQNITHQQKKMNTEQLRIFRDRFSLSMSDEAVEQLQFYRPDTDSVEIRYLHERRNQLGGYLPERLRFSPEKLISPSLSLFEQQLSGTQNREISTTMAFVRILHALLKDRELGKRIVPIVPDESRTFGMEGLFRQIGIYAPFGQTYTPVDDGQVMYYREDKKGQLLEEGINEAGSFCSWMAAATSYSTNQTIMIPFYIYYSMFGFQRVGDFVWAAADMRARGFILGATAGRTTLAGEGLQHQDGHNLLFYSSVPNCLTYDPCFNYELAVIIQDGLQRMITKQENVFYYITLMNENYVHPALPENAAFGIIQGMYLLKENKVTEKHVQLLGSGTILLEVIAASELLHQDFGVSADIWSVTSFSQLRREALEVARFNLLHPDQPKKTSYVTQCFSNRLGPVVAATDYIRLNADQIRDFIPNDYWVLGTDGFGRSDTREQLRSFFEVNRYYIVLAVLTGLCKQNKIPKEEVIRAIERYRIPVDKANPSFS